MHLDVKPPGPIGCLQGCISKLAATLTLAGRLSSSSQQRDRDMSTMTCALAIGATHSHHRMDIRKSFHPSILVLPSHFKTPSFVLAQHKMYA